MRGNRLFAIAALLMATAIGLGAFGAHALSRLLAYHDKTETWATANQYHFYHALGLFLVAYLYKKTGKQPVVFVYYMLCGGLILFSGSLYLLSLSNWSALGAITPIGGLIMIIAWAWLGRIMYLFKKIS